MSNLSQLTVTIDVAIDECINAHGREANTFCRNADYRVAYPQGTPIRKIRKDIFDSGWRYVERGNDQGYECPCCSGLCGHEGGHEG
jgi:hypothetical protein